MKKNTKGFTLIELLAVIVILAIIALIATPLTINVINDAKLKADENSAHGVMDAARLYYAEQMLKDSPVLTGVTVGDLTLSGEGPTDDSVAVTYDDNGQITIGEMTFKNGGCHQFIAGKIAACEESGD